MNKVIFVLASLWTVGSSIKIEECPGALKRDKHLAVFQNKCYYFYLDMKKDFGNAQEVCQQNGGNLASIKTSAINDFVWKKIRNEFYYHGQIWIGLSDRQREGKYKWLDGSMLDFDNFQFSVGRFFPFFDRTHKFKDCIAMNARDGKWQDQGCVSVFYFIDNKHSFVCDYDAQKKSVITTPTPTAATSTVMSTLRSQSTCTQNVTTAPTSTTVDIASSTTKPVPNIKSTKIATTTTKPIFTTSHTSSMSKQPSKSSNTNQTSMATRIPPSKTPTITVQHSSSAFTKDTTLSPSAYTSPMSKQTSNSSNTNQTSMSTRIPPSKTPTITVQHSSSAFTKDTTLSPSAYTFPMSKQTSKSSNTNQTSMSTHIPPFTTPRVTIQHSSRAFTKDTTPSPSIQQSSNDIPKGMTTTAPLRCPPCDLLNLNCGAKGNTIELVGNCIICKCRS